MTLQPILYLGSSDRSYAPCALVRRLCFLILKIPNGLLFTSIETSQFFRNFLYAVFKCPLRNCRLGVMLFVKLLIELMLVSDFVCLFFLEDFLLMRIYMFFFFCEICVNATFIDSSIESIGIFQMSILFLLWT